jgi:hypothetical protein
MDSSAACVAWPGQTPAHSLWCRHRIGAPTVSFQQRHFLNERIDRREWPRRPEWHRVLYHPCRVRDYPVPPRSVRSSDPLSARTALIALEFKLMSLRNIWGSHSISFEWYLLRDRAAWLLCEPTFLQKVHRKIWGLHGGDYEECRPLGYQNSVHTSQETHYFSVTEPSLLMIRKILGFHGGYYEECENWRFGGTYHPPTSEWQETVL